MTFSKARFLLSWLFVYLVAQKALAAEEDERKKVEVTAALSVYLPFLDTSYENIYSPPFSGRTLSSSATQTLSITAARKLGLSLGFAFLPRERIGIQVLFDTFDTSIEGESSPYEVELDYIARPPPDYVPQENHYRSTQDWSDPEGNLKNIVFSGNLVLCTGDEGIRGAVSGGVSVFRTRATVQSLGYTTLWLGGHSVLFLENYELEFETEAATKLGLNVGGELSVPLGPRVAFAIDGRYYYAPLTSADIHVTEIVNLDQVVIRESREAIQSQMSPAPIEMDLSFFRLGFGLKLRL